MLTRMTGVCNKTKGLNNYFLVGEGGTMFADAVIV
jgi:hypothetical protein